MRAKLKMKNNINEQEMEEMASHRKPLLLMHVCHEPSQFSAACVMEIYKSIWQSKLSTVI